ncbi:fatty acyl-AMP ligase [Allokutzneria multivorans]|uniref:Fatty acyl-AMP ligase n=1 Tax=Allokutzneria multivorans TaxID=1142134 RepID=A0ABP7SHL0_9PSEU
MFQQSVSVTEILRGHAEWIGDQQAVVLVEDVAEARQDALTYSQLDHDARRVAATLLERVAPGERVLLAYPSGTEFVRAFLGCLYAGIVAVPAPLPAGGNHYMKRTTGIAIDTGATTVLTGSAQLPAVEAWLEGQGWSHITPLATDAIELADADDWALPHIGADTPALIQYTSGTTTDPKGVVITHGNLVSNAGALWEATGAHEGVRSGGWAPLYHDMGVGQLMLPLLSGGTCVLIAPMVFLKRPHVWLELISRYRLELSAAPNFAYELCVQQTTDEQLARLDLSGWRWALNGAEPINLLTLEQFRAKFSAVGYRATTTCPVYGLAEATVYVSGIGEAAPAARSVDAVLLEKDEFVPLGEAEKHADAHELVSCGPVRDYAIRIVDADSREVLPEGRIGEIWLRGNSVGSGYWRNEAESRRVFDVETACGDGGYVRTGDLGVLYEDELYVTGRIAETLEVGGRRFYPHHLEREVAALLPKAVAVGAAIKVGGPVGSVVLVQELRGRYGRERLAEIAEQIRACLHRRLGSALGGVVLVRRGAVRRTTSGKVRRVEMRELFLDGALEPLYSDLSPAADPAAPLIA